MSPSPCCLSSRPTPRCSRWSATWSPSSSTPRATCTRCWASTKRKCTPEAARPIGRNIEAGPSRLALSVKPAMHIHLDAIGGVAGDMFIAAVLDAFPDLREGMLGAIAAAGLPAQIHVGVAEHRDHTLTGLRFKVVEPREPDALAGAHHHPHTPFAEIRARLEASPLAAAVKQRAIAIFTELAIVEAQVHGKTVDSVSFHEL